ncbi:MAG: hypothetical protein FJ276_24020, partial [Planctomycetes bacterium]|nr:hypothetical protein [Planctomycetota bacterium]
MSGRVHRGAKTMAISERTRYNMKRLHRVFAASCVALLLTTVWMFAVDHRRQWKAIQRTNDRMEARMAEWRRSQLTMLDARAGRDRLRQEMAKAEAQDVPAAQLEAFRREVLSDARRRNVAEPTLAELDRLAKELRGAAEAARPPARAALLAELWSVVEAARFREDAAQRERKFAEARWEAAKAVRGIAVRDNRPSEELSRKQAEVDRLKAAVDTATAAHEAARDHRAALANVLREMTDAETTLRKQLVESEADMSRLDQLTTERQSSYFTFRGIVPLPGKKWLEMPFLDAFNSPRKIDNLWSEGLEQQLGSFRRVRRFDRCTTCHQNIHKTLPGTSETPAYPLEQTHEFALPLPGGESGEPRDRRPASAEEDFALFDLWGIRLADEGLLDNNAVTVAGVRPDSPAWRARVASRMNRRMVAAELRDQLLQTNGIDLGLEPVDPGLEVGDVIVAVDGQPVPEGRTGRPWVAARLIEAARPRDASTAESNADEPHLRLVVRRGVPNPYASHPRLDLFVGSSSPHKLEDFACTVCHEGQGSATEFRWASHEPNDPDTRRRWQSQYGWFDNKHWAFPMLPARFAESACLKCHHDVLELDRGAECDDFPAPQVLRGYHLIRTLGCFGCHDIDGFGESGRVGPDLRLEPNTHAAALQMKSAPDAGYDKLTDTEKAWIDHLIADPGDEQTRDRVRAMIVEDAGGSDVVGNAATAAGGEGGLGGATSAPRFSAQVHRELAPLLQTRRQPGTLRKVGPSLRHVASKLDEAFLFDWIRDPVRFRPATRMPRAFGLWDHLPATSLLRRQVELRAELAGLESESAPADSRRVAATRNELARIESQLAEVDTREQRLEPIEILSAMAYLRERSQPFELLNRADDTPPATS